MQHRNKTVWAWAAYDVGNSAFATVVMAGFFPVFFKEYWSSGSEVTVSMARLGFANASAGLCIALAAPFLGAVADSGCCKKRFLAGFALLGIAATAGLALPGEGMWHHAAALYVLGALGFSGANIFYDALLTSVSDRKTVDRVSALGYALGYLGGGLVFAFCVLIVLHPGLAAACAGLFNSVLPGGGVPEASGSAALRTSFIITAGWWALFTVPLLLCVPETWIQNGLQSSLHPVRDGVRQLVHTFREVRSVRPVWLFLLAYWCYIDGVYTVIRMAVDYGMSLGFSRSHLIAALLVTQFVAFPCSLLFGLLGQRVGVKKTLCGTIAGYLVVVVWGVCMTTVAEFYALALLVGCVQGGVQSLSRSLYARIIPPERSGQFFGFYNMVGKYASIIGPALMGASAYLTRSPRAGIGSLAVLFAAGCMLLWRVKIESI